MPLLRRAAVLAKHLWESFLREDCGRRCAATGDLVPHGTLKSVALKRKLAWAADLPYKFVTEQVALLALERLETHYHLQYPVIPGVSVKRWRAQQAARVTKLVYRYRKNSAARVSRKAMTDHDETQAWSAEAGCQH